ncbi:MAG: serine/threonine-protein kinase [Usitatibacteraceae bacterium]
MNFAVIDGSAGYRAVLAAFLLAQWPEATIEEVDPFAETLRGIGLAFGTNADIILLGGIGTTAEAIASLERLHARDHCPPVILMVARELAPQVPLMMEAGAASVLFKDAFSRNTLIDTIAALLDQSATGKRATQSPEPETFGEFSFIAAGQCHTLVIPHFQFLGTLGASGLAHVFNAERIEDRKRVVIKIQLTTPHHGADARAFGERYRLVNALKGHHVVRYLDAGVADSWPYVVLEHLAGGDLRRRMLGAKLDLPADGGITPREAVHILSQLCGALNTFHANNFAHMDLKPENIFFRGDDIVLIDFNISTRFGHVARNRITGDVLGSPFYMSPEQGQGLAIDGRSDLYSAGVIFYEMLTGALPYTGESAAQIIYRHIHDEIPLLPARVRAYQPIIDTLMAKDREQRVASAAALATMLTPFLGDIDPHLPLADTHLI